ncbi:hypothetical protein [Vibrio sp. Hal054]|uniref:hypothetical protein n=1 Tax=Vibrio sp. Hal054 TaxID=3035158 RepID=UPI00301E1C8B
MNHSNSAQSLGAIQKRFAGSYFIQVGKHTIDIQTNGQACRDWANPSEWVVTYSDDFDGDYLAEYKTKKLADVYALNLYNQLTEQA